MKSKLSRTKSAIQALPLIVCLQTVPAGAALVFTIEAPGVTQSTVPGVTTENFDDGNYSPSAVGAYAGGAVNAASQFGGAGGTGYFLFATAGSPATLTLGTPQTYFGFWWSAGDAANSLSLYDTGNNLLGAYVIGDILPLLSPAYFGNPGGTFAGQNAGEAYAYLNFTATGSDFISRVVFGGSNFESDNHSVTDVRITPPGTPPGQSVPDGGSTVALSGLALLGVLAARRRSAGKRLGTM